MHPKNPKKLTGITKYPNRRLYDNQKSQYITLRDVRESLFKGDRPRVYIKASGKDITAEVYAEVVRLDAREGLIRPEALVALLQIPTSKDLLR